MIVDELKEHALSDVLRDLKLTEVEVEGVVDRIAEQTTGLMLYGSRARDDFLPTSDFDLLRLTPSTTSSTFKVGRASVSSYTKDQLRSASGTLFGTHLRRDGRVLIEIDLGLSAIIDELEPADPEQLLDRVSKYSMILHQPAAEELAHVSGLVRLARYLLRTAVYAVAMAEGRPCFSVRQLAEQYNEPRLATLLASDPEVTGPPSMELLDELKERLVGVIGPLHVHDLGSLEAVAVAFWDRDRSLAALAIRAADEGDAESLNYSDLPKVLL